MPTEKTILLYTYEELSEEAKRNARDWWLSIQDSDSFDTVVEDFAECARLLGVVLKTRPVKLMDGSIRHDYEMAWSLNYSQGDYAAFEGHYSYAPKSVAAVSDHTGGKDATLIDIAKRLQKAQAKNFYKLAANISYDHYYGIQVEVFHKDSHYRDIGCAEDDIKEGMRDLARWFYERLREENDYLSEEEAISEALMLNEYTFDENGKKQD